MQFKLLNLGVLIPLTILIVFMYWYQWGTNVLSPAEVDHYMTKIETQTQTPGAQHDLPALRKFLNEDDGKPIYTVNLYKFNAVADYPKATGFSGTGEQAYDRFSEVMVPLMVKRGSHPIFGSNWADEASSNWDRIVIVRYRSRRDLVDLFATDDFAEASLHKWASLQDHNRMLVQGIHIPDGVYVITLIAILIGLAMQLVQKQTLRPRHS